MYSYLLDGDIHVNYSIQGECFGFYITNEFIGVQVEDDGTWFNSLGPFSLSRSNELIKAIEVLIKGFNNEDINISPPFEIGIKGTSFYLGIQEEYVPEIQNECETFVDADGDKILLEFNSSMQASTYWIKDLTILLPCFKVLIQNVMQ